MREFKFNNGDKVQEIVTGFTGIISGTCFYLTGCTSYLITAKSKNEHAKAESLWYDEGRLELLQEEVIPSSLVSSDADGCDIEPPIK